MFKKIIFIFNIIFFFINFNLFARDYLVIQSTTSTNNSGLVEIIETKYEEKYSIDLRFVSVGSGQAIINGKNGDGDLLLVHSLDDEINFIKDGYGLERYEIMYNNFVILGPRHDPAGLKNAQNIGDAMNLIKSSKSTFISRGDNSGTYKKELSFWQSANIKITKKDKWYLQNGLGMGATLNMASELNAYTLSDKGSWIAFKNKNNLSILFDKDKSLINIYIAIPVNPEKFPQTEYKKAMIFINWLIGTEGKSIINNFRLNGEQLFFSK